MHWDTFKQDSYSAVGGDAGCMVSEVRAGITSPMPDQKGFNTETVRDTPNPFEVKFQKFSSLRVNGMVSYGLHVCICRGVRAKVI